MSDYEKLAGKYIAIEGIDGSGKSSAISTIVTELKKSCNNLVPSVVSEPYSSPIYHRLFGDNLDENLQLQTPTNFFLYSAARSELLKNIEEDLMSGTTVISDRCYWSSLAYQLTDLPFAEILKTKKLLENSFNVRQPDLLIVFNGRINKCLERKTSPDAIERQGVGYYSKVAKTYLDLVDHFANQKHIDGFRNSKFAQYRDYRNRRMVALVNSDLSQEEIQDVLEDLLFSFNAFIDDPYGLHY